MTVDLDMVRASLTIPELLKVYGFKATSAKEDRYNDCPSCGAGSHGKFTVFEDMSMSMCHSCGFKGNVFAVATAILGLSRSDFPKVLETCAAIAGVEGEHDPAELARTIEARKAKRAHQAELAARERSRAEAGARAVWDKLKVRSSKGQLYVAERGVMPIHAGKECRYTRRSVCLPLWRDGQLVNIVGRRFDGGKPKIRGLDGCGTLGTFGKPALKASHQGPIVIVEGFFDYLSAKQLSPTRLVLGAHGCNNLPYVATVAAKIAAGSSAGLVFVTHQDDAGRRAMAKAQEAAREAGVSPAAMTEFDVGEDCKDLNEYLCKCGSRAP